MTEYERVKNKVEYISSWDDIEYAISSAGLVEASSKITEKQLRNAGLIQVFGTDPERDTRITYKHIGSSQSDQAFVSSIEVKDENNKWHSVYKQYSNNFKEVKITWDKIEQIYLKTHPKGGGKQK